MESSLVDPQEQNQTLMRGQEDHEKKRRRRRFWILAAIIVLVIRAVVVAVTIPGSSKNNTDAVGSLESQQGKSNETTAPTFGITNTPTMNPTTPPPSVPGMDNSTLDYVDDGAVLTKPTNTAKFQEDFLLALQHDESSYLGGSYPPDSYMGKALQWILEEDIFTLMK